MKKPISIFILLFISFNLIAQNEIKFDLKSSDEKLINYKILKDKGVLLLTEKRVKRFAYNLVVRLLTIDGKLKWESEIEGKDLSGGSLPVSINVVFNDDHIYLFSCFASGFITDYYINQIDYAGKIKSDVIKSSKVVVIDMGINSQGAFIIQEKRKGVKDSGIKRFIVPINSATLKLEPGAEADLPVLEKGLWNFIGRIDSLYYFNGIVKGYNEDHSLDCEIHQIGKNGNRRKSFGIKAFADHNQYPVPRKLYSEGRSSPYAEFYADTLEKSFYLYGFNQSEKGDYNTGLGATPMKHEGFYICKYDLGGELIWNKSYPFKDLKKLGTLLPEKSAFNDWKYVYFNVENDGSLMFVVQSERIAGCDEFLIDNKGNIIYNSTDPASLNIEKYFGNELSCYNGDYNFMRCQFFSDLKSHEKTNSGWLNEVKSARKKNGASIANSLIDAYHFKNSTLVIQMRIDTGGVYFYSVSN